MFNDKWHTTVDQAHGSLQAALIPLIDYRSSTGTRDPRFTNQQWDRVLDDRKRACKRAVELTQRALNTINAQLDAEFCGNPSIRWR